MVQRVQLKRTKGYRKPEDTINVARPTKWGNPFRVGVLVTPDSEGWAQVAPVFAEWVHGEGMQDFKPTTPTEAVAMFREYLRRKVWTWSMAEHARAELKGNDLACWCALDQPCHADVLLEVANG